MASFISFTLLLLCAKVSRISCGITVRKTTDYDWKWDDRGSDADTDGAFWKPRLNSGEFESFISYVNTIGHSAPSETAYVITSAPSGALADPIDAQLIWSDSGSGGDIDIYWYRLTGPSGYTCLGDHIYTAYITGWGGYKCIHNDYLMQVSATVDTVWDDSGSGADQDGKVYRINVDGYPYTYYKMTPGTALDTQTFYTILTDTPLPNIPPITIDFVKAYAPVLRFDRAAASYGYPMNAQLYIDRGQNGNENNVLDTQSNPTYYRAVQCTHSTIKITYWFFYGDQHECFGSWGAHNGDWERIIVEIVNNQLSKVTYHQHGGHFTLNVGDFYTDGNHPIVYVGKVAHGSYYDSNSFGGGCGYFYDYRNPSDLNDYLYTQNNLINLETSNEYWIQNNVHICCSNPLTFLKNGMCVEQGCDDLGCNVMDCDSTDELGLEPWNCMT